MVSYEKALEFVKKEFPGTKFAEQRIEETEYSYIINCQPEKFLETGNILDMMIPGGTQLILKESGEVYSLVSNPINDRMVIAKTLDEFNQEKQKFTEYLDV